MNYQNKANELFDSQKNNWPLLADNFDGLQNAQLKSFSFEGFTIQVQFNPKRIASSAAKVDKTSIGARKCFLCAANRPAEQTEVFFEPNYDILCNPFPIFRLHYTIAHLNHTPQEIGSSFADYLLLSKALPELVVFYNAPKCGASAPDHLHFQAGNIGFLPIEHEFESIKSKYGEVLLNHQEISVTAVNDGLRRFILLESGNYNEILRIFKPINRYTTNLQNGDDPMLNILSWYNNGWRVGIFIREKHRPWQYFEEGEKNILLSPGSTDYGGVMITPLEKDFEKITRDDIIDIMNQTSLNQDTFEELKNYLKQNLK